MATYNPYATTNALLSGKAPAKPVTQNQKAASFVANTTQKPAFSYTSGTYVNPGQSSSSQSILGVSTTANSGNSGSTGGSREQIFRDMYGSQETMPPGWQPPGSTSGAAEEEARRREEETRNAINSGYGEYESNLRGLEPVITQNQDESLTSASKTFDQIFGGLTDQKTTNLQKLDASRTAVDTRKAQSIKDLQQNLGNTMRAASMNFGAMGAGDTSATRVMLPYAYTKLAGAQEGSIAKQANEQQFDIDQDEKDTELEYSKMWRETEVEKESQMQSIKDYYGEKIMAVKTALAQAPLDKSRDLAALSQSLLAEAKANLRQLEAEDRQKKESVKTWATNRMAQLNDMKLTLANNASFTPRDIAFQELSAGGQISPTMGVGSDGIYNPMALAQKKREDYLG